MVANRIEKGKILCVSTFIFVVLVFGHANFGIYPISVRHPEIRMRRSRYSLFRGRGYKSETITKWNKAAKDDRQK